MSPATDSSPYVCITSDTHAGAAIDTYRDYLDPAYRAAFDAWRGRYRNRYRNPSKKHIGGKKTKNWDSAERFCEHGLRGGVLLPLPSPGEHWLRPLNHPDYDRLWAVIHVSELREALEDAAHDEMRLAFQRARAERAAAAEDFTVIVAGEELLGQLRDPARRDPIGRRRGGKSGMTGMK